MALIPFPVGRFGGLDLREPEEVGAQGAIDLLNVDFDSSGAVRTRYGSTKVNSVEAAEDFLYLSGWLDGVIAHASGATYAYSAAGTQITSTANTTHDTAALGTAAAGPYLYLSRGNLSSIIRFDGSAFSTPGGMPNGRYLAVQAGDNRLVTGYTAAGEQSRVKFSDAGAPETWTSTSFVDLYPNDGEYLTSLVSWGGLVFAFKASRFFVFYGNSTLSDGTPVFNYREVNYGIGCDATSVDLGVTSHCAVAGDDGVYFLNREGLFRTTGGRPEKISLPLDPFFKERGYAFSTLENLSAAPIDLRWDRLEAIGGRIFLHLLEGDADTGYTAVYDPSIEQWTIWKMAATTVSAFAGLSTSAEGNNLYYTPGTGFFYKMDPTATTDDGTAIASHYRSGFYTVGNQPSQEATIRESILDGIGTPTFSVSKDFGAVPTTGGGAKASVTLGTSPAYGNGRHRVAQKGRRFSYQIEATSGRWQVNSITHQIRSIRPPGVKST